MSDFTTLVSDEQKLGVGEILICNRETKGKFEPVKYFFGKVILAIGGGGDKIFIVEEKDKYKSEVKSIQINPALQKKMYNFSTSNISNNVEEEELKKMEEEFTDMNNELNDAQNNNQNISTNEKNNE